MMLGSCVPAPSDNGNLTKHTPYDVPGGNTYSPTDLSRTAVLIIPTCAMHPAVSRHIQCAHLLQGIKILTTCAYTLPYCPLHCAGRLV